jgi:uncharacterized membrane protein
MTWIAYALAAAFSWGMYGPVIHKGQVALGNPMRAFLCVGMAYFLVAVLVPLFGLGGSLKGFNTEGVIYATLGGTVGALGAICVILAFRNGGIPNYVMPIVFGLAPVINVVYTMATHPPKTAINPLLYVGFLLAAAGAGMVLYFKPSA